MKEIPTEFTDVPEIKKAIEKTIEASYTHEERAQYDGYWDQISIEKTIKVDAKREGREEGILEGRKEGAAARNREIAAEMLQEKLPDDMILKVSKITLEELSKLKASL